jgi:hypothetical protein
MVLVSNGSMILTAPHNIRTRSERWKLVGVGLMLPVCLSGLLRTFPVDEVHETVVGIDADFGISLCDL